jgi:hypothetical protein
MALILNFQLFSSSTTRREFKRVADGVCRAIWVGVVVLVYCLFQGKVCLYIDDVMVEKKWINNKLGGEKSYSKQRNFLTDQQDTRSHASSIMYRHTCLM